MSPWYGVAGEGTNADVVVPVLVVVRVLVLVTESPILYQKSGRL